MFILNNDLFQKCQVKIQLEFINKTKYIQRYENLKRILKENFSEISLSTDNSSKPIKKYFIKFFENSDYKNNLILNDHQIDCKFLFSIQEEEMQEKIISTYNNYLLTLDTEKQQLDRLIFISDEKSSLNNSNSDNIQIIPNEIHSLDYLIVRFESILSQIITELNKTLRKECEKTTDEGDKKSKNFQALKRKSEINLIIGEYKASFQLFVILSEIAKQINDNLLFAYSREGMAISIAMEELSKIENRNDQRIYLAENKYVTDVEINLEAALQIYKKAKSYENVINTYFKYAFYCILFKHKTKSFFDTMKRIYDEIEYLPANSKIFYLFKIKNVYNSIGMKRKSIFFLYMAMGVCLENMDLMNLLPFVFKEVCEQLGVNDIYNNKIENPTHFIETQKILKKIFWKKIQFNSLPQFTEDKKEMKETTKKRIDKENKLYVSNRLESIKNLLLDPKWDPIQFNIYLNLMNFYKSYNKKIKFSYTISLLQTLSSFLSVNEQKNMISSIIGDSGLLQEKVFLNLLKLPVLVRITPHTSDTKFDIIKNYSKKNISEKSKKESYIGEDSESVSNPNSAYDKIFLYNPWEKDLNVNYYWTAESLQRVSVDLYNPLAVELRINKIILLFEGNKPFSFPTSTIIPPNSVQSVTCKIKPIERGITSITGIKYEIFNASAVQFVDKNGNGLYSYHENFYNESSMGISTKKEKISLANIKIYPEIPQLNIKVLDSSAKIINGSLDLFEHQFYNFSFLLENKSEYPIKELNVSIYAYKKDDYKIILDEIRMKPNSSYIEKNGILIDKEKSFILNYDYLHKRNFKKIEFKIYYTSSLESPYASDFSVNIKPYLYYQKNLNTLKLVEFYDLKVIPMLSNNHIHLITITDPKINKNYSKFFCSDKYYVSFSIGNCNDDSLSLKIFSKENLIKEELCESKNLREISLVIDSEIKMSEFSMFWEFNRLNDVSGKIDFSQIFKEFSFRFKDRIKFEIGSQENLENGIGSITITYRIINNTDKNFNNLKLFIYLYQIYDQDNLIFNNQLNDQIFYEGSLSSEIKELKESETKIRKLKLFPKPNVHISTTCLVVDPSNEIVYMSPISKTFYLNDD